MGGLEALGLTSVLRVRQHANGTAINGETGARSGRAIGATAVDVTLRRLEENLLMAEEGDPSPRRGRPRRYDRPTSEGVDALREETLT